MNKKLLSVLIGLLFIVAAGYANTALANAQDANPIDEAFAKEFQEAHSTVETNYVAEKYMQAWKAELANIAVVTKGKYQYDEDKDRIDAYVAAYEKVAAAAVYVEWLRWSDTDAPPAGRHFGTGAASGGLLAKAQIYKQATLNLVTSYQRNSAAGSYVYLYSGNGAELAKRRAE